MMYFGKEFKWLHAFSHNFEYRQHKLYMCLYIDMIDSIDNTGNIARHYTDKLYKCRLHLYYSALITNTINGERFAGLNIRGFSCMKFFTEIVSQCICHQCLLFTYS